MTEQMSVNDNNVSEHTLNVGQHFNDYEQLSKTVNVFCKEHYHPFVIRTRSQKQVLYKCCHGIKQNSKCLGKRPNQHYYYKNCKAQINFYKSKNEKWKLTKLLLNHNHTVGKEEYSNYGKAKIMNENDYETATDLILSSAKDGMVAAAAEIEENGAEDNKIQLSNGGSSEQFQFGVEDIPPSIDNINKFDNEAIINDETDTVIKIENEDIVEEAPTYEEDKERIAEIEQVTCNNLRTGPSTQSEEPIADATHTRKFKVVELGDLLQTFANHTSTSIPEPADGHIDLFFKSLAATAKTLLPWHLAEAKRRIFQVMAEIEEKNMREKYFNSMPSSSSS